jgi:DNA-binding transcriptional LysR family regulator
MRNLEDRLNLRLLNRTTRSVTPTEAGERLLQRLEPALLDITDGLEDLNQLRDSPAGTLRLNVPRQAATLLLAPLFARFHQRYPLIRLEVVTDNGLVDIVAGGFDAGIRFGEYLAQDMIALPLQPVPRFIVVASPEYLDLHGRPNSPEDLKSHACICRRMASGVLYAWEFGRAGKTLAVQVDGPLTLDDETLIISAAQAGIGCAYVYESAVQTQLASGELLAVLDEWCPASTGFFLYYPSRRWVPAALRAFIEVLREAG